MKLKERLYPSLLVSESLFAIVPQERQLLDAIKRILDTGFYKKIEIGSIKDKTLRKEFWRLLQDTGLECVQWLTVDINEMGLNPSSMDRELRKRTMVEMGNLIDIAVESGAHHVATLSGPDSGEAVREDARKCLEEVMYVTSEKVAQYPGMKLLLEPLDRGVHKNNLIGPTDEAVALMEKINKEHDNCRIAWDSAHVALNREDLCGSVKMAASCMEQMHIANAVIDPALEGYGDWHIPMGEPGFMNREVAAEILRTAAKELDPNRMFSVAMESRCLQAEAVFEKEQETRSFLSTILELDV